MSKSFIQDNVEEAILGNSSKLNVLISSLRLNTFSPEDFFECMMALKKLIPRLTKEHELLMGVILNIDWSVYSENCIDVFLEFITELVSTQAYYLNLCVRSLIKKFMVKVELFDEELKNYQKKCKYIHHSLKTIITIAPLAMKFMNEAVSHFFPYTGSILFTLEMYIGNILHMVSYSQVCRFQVLALIIDKLLSIDVGIPRDKMNTSASAATNSSGDSDLQFDIDVVDLGSSQYQKETEKLDRLMTVLLSFIRRMCINVDGDLDWIQTEVIFDDLLKIYDGVILKTQQSSHVQFVLFYVASFDKRLYKKFTQECWSILENPTNAQIIRQASSSYLASFLVRANFVHKDFISQQMRNLSEWIHRYLKLQDGDNVIPDYFKHASFYSACQTLFYIFVYHHEYYVDTTKGKAFVKSLEFSRIVLSKLNPLKYCLKAIVEIFARITRMYEIVFCYSIIEHNNRNLANRFFQNTPRDSHNTKIAHQEMETFFPFDPYILPASAEFIVPLYQHWHGFSLEQQRDDLYKDKKEHTNKISHGDDVDDIDRMFENFENHLGILPEAKIPKQSQSRSFDMMCISPGFSLVHR